MKLCCKLVECLQVIKQKLCPRYKYHNYFYYAIFCLIVTLPLRAQDSPLNPFQPSVFSSKIRLDTPQLIRLILENYDEVALQQLELPKSDSDLLRSRAPYNPILNFNISRTVSNPRYANSLTSSPPLTQDALLFSYRQLFLSGTTLEAGIGLNQSAARQNNNSVIASLGTNVFTPSNNTTTQIYIGIRQELLKNAFGATQLRRDEVNINKSIILREQLLFRLASLVVDTMIIFWDYYRTDINVETSKRMLKNIRNVKRVTRRKIRLGLSERFEYNLWESLELQSENLLSDVIYSKEARLRALLSNLKLDKNLPVSFNYILEKQIPANVNPAKDLPTAYQKRSDYIAAKLIYNNALQNIKITKQELKPSLSLGARYGSYGYDPSFNNSFSQTTRGNYPETTVDLQLQAPLNDLNALVNRRNARVDLKIAEISLAKAKRQVTDDVSEAYEYLKVQFKKLKHTRSILRHNQNYYKGIYRGYQSGRFSATNIREALDSLVQSELGVNSALIDFNIALLRYDLACNRIFSKYDVDIEEILEEKYPGIGKLHKK